MSNPKITTGSSRQLLGISPAPHLHSGLKTGTIMLITSAALLPAWFLTMYYYGFGCLWQFLICAGTALVCESTAALLRSRSIFDNLLDYSFLVTALILSLTIPPLTPWYLTVSLTVFAILFVKQMFGGLGMNIFNPAMAGFVFLLISAPSVVFNTVLTPSDGAYQTATLDATYEIIFKENSPLPLQETLKELSYPSHVDEISGATFLESLKTARKAGGDNTLVHVDFIESNYSPYLYLALAYAFGGLVLMGFRIIFKRMVLVFALSIIVFSSLGKLYFSDVVMPPLQQFLFGGTMIAMFFIITDPVTNAGTAKGRITFSILCAFLIVLIRAFGSYSDSVAFAVMLSNAAAPLIDVLTRRRSFGSRFKREG
ncbi:MAG: RnfABCDGE type electron transport complex subunit D [Succinivibrio sp.]|nr:RnfABCDGE type electron transport complex subunit D [Succinivibrio sp.]